jgi:hypothetical protein
MAMTRRGNIILVLIAIAIATAGGMVVWALNKTEERVITNRDLIEQLQEESFARRNATCRIFEQREIVAVNRVISTYRFLDKLPRSEWHTGLTQTVARNASITQKGKSSPIYEEAITERAPEYCNEKRGQRQVGLPETAKFMPKLPKERNYSYMLKNP